MTAPINDVIGFVGTGTITASIIEGLLAKPGLARQIIVSPRNAEMAARLAAEHDEVTIAASNQAVVDAADIVFLAVRPQIAADVIPELTFRTGQLVVSVIAATERSRLKDWIRADIELVQAVPLPFVEKREGVTAIYPRSSRVTAMFNGLGTAIECDTRKDYDLLAAASATMAFYFGLLGRAVEWLESEGLPEANGRAYLSTLFKSLAGVAAAREDAPLHALSREYATKGGLNEQVWMDFDQRGGTRALQDALARVLFRITK